jgi:pimeloyl-ACP methyl ester carboxylesterase
VLGEPATRYARAGDVNIAYQVIGDGPVDLVFVFGLFSNVEVAWEEPSCAAFLRRLSEFSRLILFDRRGCGLSDREGGTVTPTLEERMDDVLAVLDAVGVRRVALFGFSEGGALAALFAATYPERTTRLVMYGTVARSLRDDDHPWGLADADQIEALKETMSRGWGRPSEWGVRIWAPSMVGDEHFTHWFGKWCRHSVSRGAIRPLLNAVHAYDVADVYEVVRVPTLILHRRYDELVPVTQGRWAAERIPDARLVELDGADHLPWVGDAEQVVAEVEAFLVGSRTIRLTDRRLLTVMVTDLAASKGQLGRLGDAAWRELLAVHHRDVAAHLARFGGQEVTRLGDGYLAVFDGPARAIRCAQGLVAAATTRGPSLRVGLDCGECDIVEADVQGIPVQAAARIVELAAPGQVLASSTVRDLVAGSGIRFGTGRKVELTGSVTLRTVFPVITHGASPEEVRRLASDRANVLRREGEHWTVAYAGQVVTLRDSKGIRDLAQLLASPQQEVHVLDLATEMALGSRTVPAGQARDAGLRRDGGVGDLILDDTARAAYAQRIRELERTIEEVETHGDRERATQARLERDTLVSELAAAYGLGGRARRTPDHVERTRKRVSRRVRDALRRIDREHPVLGRHLHASLRMGVFCCYRPEGSTTWWIET